MGHFMSIRVLTGITTSGTPHLGNYVGAIRPAIRAAGAPGTESFYFLADLHSLIKVQDPERTQRSTLEIAATWLACGLDPEKVWLYRQSDVPEITELMWLLTCVAGKGFLIVRMLIRRWWIRIVVRGDDDAGITAGLFMYPVLMAADILLLMRIRSRWDAIRFSISRWRGISRSVLIIFTVGSILCFRRPLLMSRWRRCRVWMGAR